ncbi:MAG: glycosyltransferase family 2 protein [bacterium]|nr:glycosyltransferase family 2 protein [bacterium]
MISVIVPLFNSEKYIYNCVKSVIANTYKNFEIIIVNDGSNDFSLSILNQINDKRIKIFNNNGKGPGSARNLGLAVATGEYIFFLDSDDTLPINALMDLKSNIEDNDIVIGNYKIFYDSGTCDNFITPNDSKFNTFFESVTVWNRLYKKQFIQEANAKFESITQGEDRLFLADLYLYNPKVKVINNYVYNWLRHENDLSPSLTHIKDHTIFDAQVKCMIEFKKRLYDKIDYKDRQQLLDHLRYSCIYLLNIKDNCDNSKCDFEKFNDFVNLLEFGNNQKLYKEIFKREWSENNE